MAWVVDLLRGVDGEGVEQEVDFRQRERDGEDGLRHQIAPRERPAVGLAEPSTRSSVGLASSRLSRLRAATMISSVMGCRLRRAAPMILAERAAPAASRSISDWRVTRATSCRVVLMSAWLRVVAGRSKRPCTWAIIFVVSASPKKLSSPTRSMRLRSWTTERGCSLPSFLVMAAAMSVAAS